MTTQAQALAASLDTAEKIETIVFAFLKRQTTAGALGTIEPVGNGWFRVVADGVVALVVRGPLTWNVKLPAKGLVGSDASLLEAAQIVLAA